MRATTRLGRALPLTLLLAIGAAITAEAMAAPPDDDGPGASPGDAPRGPTPSRPPRDPDTAPREAPSAGDKASDAIDEPTRRGGARPNRADAEDGNKRRRSRAWHRNKRLGPPGLDGSKVPTGSGPTIHRVVQDDVRNPLVGWAAAADDPDYRDQRRRPARFDPGPPWAHRLQAGEAFKYDLHFAGNPAGNIEARVAQVVSDPRGAPPHGAPTVRLEATAVSAGVFGMLATVTDEMYAIIDARTGASIDNHNHVIRGGLMAPYKDRHTQTDYEGRGYVRIVDTKDDKRPKRLAKQVPETTMDPLALMAWARFLDLEDGERAVVHTLDARALLRVEVVGRGRKAPDTIPSLAKALGIGKSDISMIEGTLTRVDQHDQPLPNKRSTTFRAYISADGRGIPIVMETDIYVGVFRLSLAGYDPPRGSSPGQVDPPPERGVDEGPSQAGSAPARNPE